MTERTRSGHSSPLRVFLSYARENEAYRTLVKGLAVRLRNDGVDARLDEWHLEGKTISEFMSHEVRHADKILILCSPQYKQKVHAMEDGKRVTGSGTESMLVSTRLWVDVSCRKQVEAVLMLGKWKSSAPDYLVGLPYIDLSNLDQFELNYLQLLRRLTGHQETAPPIRETPATIGAGQVEPRSGPRAASGDGRTEVGKESHARRVAFHDMGRLITSRSLDAPLARLPRKPLDPQVLVKGEKKKKWFVPSEMFPWWAEATEGRAGRRVAIVAPAAAGKSVLLCRFADWLRSRRAIGESNSPNPIVLLMTPDNLLESLTKQSLWRQAEDWAAGATGDPFRVSLATGPGPLRPWLNSGAVYLLFDGLDEFGARRQGELKPLLNELALLARDHNIRIALTCREVFWSQQVPKAQQGQWERIDVMPFEASDLERLLPRAYLGPFAYDAAGRPKPGVLNRLVVSFVLALGKGLERLAPFATRYDLYEKWSFFTTEANCRKVRSVLRPEEWIELFKSTALRILGELSVAAPLPMLPDGRSAPDAEWVAMEILVPSVVGRKVKFCHESVIEFFVASALVDSFQRILKPEAVPGGLANLPLARVELDFLQPSLYGFLRDKLGPGYLKKLRRALGKPGVFQFNPKLTMLHRNVVEYVGVTATAADDTPSIAMWMLDLMGDPKLDYIIRYNAARALERIHPRAPKPYFDYMSDWGEGDWKQVRNTADQDQLCPWAIRGYRIRERTGRRVNRKPGQHPPLAVRANARIDLDLQRLVSEKLGNLVMDLLRRLPSKPTSQSKRGQRLRVDWLLINYTHAWTRWFHGDSAGILKNARALAKRKCADSKAQDNLRTWVDHAKFRVE